MLDIAYFERKLWIANFFRTVINLKFTNVVIYKSHSNVIIVLRYTADDELSTSNLIDYVKKIDSYPFHLHRNFGRYINALYENF